MTVEINWQDADSSSSNAVTDIFPKAMIMTCGGHAARSHLKCLESLSALKMFSQNMKDRYKKTYPSVESVMCHCQKKHSSGCGCMSKAFMEQSRNNFSKFLTKCQSASEFAKRLCSLFHHACDEHEWDGGKCDFHEMTVCSCGKCPNRSKHECVGKPYKTRNCLTCPFHSLAYQIEIEYRASLADNLVHPLFKRGHSNWVEASHSVFIRFRSKDIFLERLHYQLSTDLALLQANLTQQQKTKGKGYHWIPELYERLKLPVYSGVKESLEKYCSTRDKALERGKTEKAKRRRITLKIARKKEQIARLQWSKQHGGDTYGECDLENMPEKEKEITTRKKKCKGCRSTTHSRKTFEDCPCNKKASFSLQPSDSESEQPPQLTDYSLNSSDDHLSSTSDDSMYGDYQQECTCNSLGRVHKKECPKNLRNRYGKETVLHKLPHTKFISVGDEDKSDIEPEVWVRVLQHNLTSVDREAIVKPNGWLTDTVISASQDLLHQKFSNISGLQPPVLQQVRGFKAHSGKFIQIINVDNIHWCTVSSVGCQDGTVNIYDSLNWELRETTIPIVASLVSTKKESLKINRIEVERQLNGADCGVLAIAMSFDLCAGFDPGQFSYDMGKIRGHLMTCLEEGTISRFPTRGERKGQGIISSQDVELHCTCKMPEEEGVPMAECDKCNRWYHQKCQSIPEAVFKSENEVRWECKQCRQT